MRFEAFNWIIFKTDNAFGWRESAGYHVKQGRFAGSIGTDNGFNDTAFDLKIEVNECHQAAKGHDDIFNFKDILCSPLVQ